MLKSTGYNFRCAIGANLMNMNGQASRLSSVRLLSFLLLGGFSSLCFAQPITLKRHVKMGDITKYRVQFVFTVYGNDVFYTSTETDKITAVNKDGSYTVETSQADVRANSGNDLPVQQNSKPSYTTYDARGNVLDMQGTQPQAAWRDAYLAAFILPDKPINKGDTWTVNIDPKADRQTPGGTYIFTYAGMAAAPGEDTANLIKIEKKYTETSPGNPATSSGTIYVDPKDGSVVKMDEVWAYAPLMGLTTLVNGHVSYEKIS